MCGIVGVLSTGPPVHKQRLQNALQSLINRGPDDHGIWWSEDGRVGLGHRLLAITRPQSGRQPISHDGCVAVVNGQFYDLDPEFLEHSDSSALPVLYRRHGLASTLDKLRGEFCFLLYDHRSRTLMAARDRFGIKPLFWARRDQEWWFCSKASALWAAGVKPGWDERSFLHAAATQYPPPGESLFSGIKSVLPAHFVRLQEEFTEIRYWSAGSLAGSDHTPEEFREKLSECVRLRVRENAPTAVLLSGGVDSASVLALAAQTSHNLKAYTIDFPGHDKYSEGSQAAKQALASGVPHQVITLSPEDILQEHTRGVQLSEGLAVNGHLVAKISLARAVSEDGCRVLLSGEGSDELLFGYRHFGRYFGQVTDPFEDQAGLGILTSTEKPALPAHYPHFFQAKFALGRRICKLLGAKVDTRVAFDRIVEDLTAESDLERARDSWMKTALVSYILEVLGDGTEMAFSVEGRPPFLDHTLWDMGISPQDSRKTLLRKSVKGLVIDEIRQQPKHPFMAPPLGDGLVDRLRSNVVEVTHPFVDRKAALRTLDYVYRLPQLQRLEWEPALLWALSTYALQELWN
jgi:asparagine synthase (glutamine-hydrolysing)